MRITLRAVAAVACLLTLPGVTARAQNRPPNIVVIVADDMGYADIGVHGSKDIPTPNIDALATSGIRFTDAYVTGPYCGPTRAGLLTGRYPQRFGHEFNIGPGAGPHQEAGLPVEERTLADHLRSAGYRTAVFGKWHLGTAPRFFPLRRGFDEFFGFLAGGHSYTALGTEANPIYDGEQPARSMTYLTDTLASRAVAFIEQNRSRPFFLYLAFNAVHTPLEATDHYLERVKHISDPVRRTYAAMLAAMDDGIGRTLAALRERQLDENTLIFFFSDNGGPLGVASNGSSNSPLRGQKGQTWEGGIRVPFVIRWKGKLPAGKTDARPIIQLDVLPTALAAAGIGIKQEWGLDGVNLLPFLSGTRADAPHDALYWRLGGIMAIRKGDWKLVKVHEGGLQEDPAKLTLAGAQLFNIANDISERNDLTASRPEKVQELSAAWLRWRAQLRTPLWPPVGGYREGRQGCLDPSTARPLEAYAATWRGSFGTTEFVLEQRADGTGSIRVAANEPVATRTVHASADSLVVDVTEPLSSGREGAVPARLRLITYVCGDELGGFVIAIRPNRTIWRNPLTATRGRQ
jgi:arylsulfatase A-like enzyme